MNEPPSPRAIHTFRCAENLGKRMSKNREGLGPESQAILVTAGIEGAKTALRLNCFPDTSDLPEEVENALVAGIVVGFYADIKDVSTIPEAFRDILEEAYVFAISACEPGDGPTN